jgi:hypothetical protein
MKLLPLNFDRPEVIKHFINNTESDMYGGKNVEGETVNVMLQKGVGMDVRTNQKNGWIRLDSYDSNGLKELETFDGRWDK